MKPSILYFGILALAVACLLNIVISTGCITKSANNHSSVNLEGLDRAAGKYYDSPIY